MILYQYLLLVAKKALEPFQLSKLFLNLTHVGELVSYGLCLFLKSVKIAKVLIIFSLRFI